MACAFINSHDARRGYTMMQPAHKVTSATDPVCQRLRCCTCIPAPSLRQQQPPAVATHPSDRLNSTLDQHQQDKVCPADTPTAHMCVRQVLKDPPYQPPSPPPIPLWKVPPRLQAFTCNKPPPNTTSAFAWRRTADCGVGWGCWPTPATPAGIDPLT